MTGTPLPGLALLAALFDDAGPALYRWWLERRLGPQGAAILLRANRPRPTLHEYQRVERMRKAWAATGPRLAAAFDRFGASTAEATRAMRQLQQGLAQFGAAALYFPGSQV